MACQIIPKITKVSHRIQNSTKFKRKTEENTAVELEKMLNSNPEVVYNPPSVDEPTFVRKYAPPQLQAQRLIKSLSKHLIPISQVPLMHSNYKLTNQKALI